MFEAAKAVVANQNNLQLFYIKLADIISEEFKEKELNNLESLIPKFNPVFKVQIEISSKSLENFNYLKSLVSNHPNTASIQQQEGGYVLE